MLTKLNMTKEEGNRKINNLKEPETVTRNWIATPTCILLQYGKTMLLMGDGSTLFYALCTTSQLFQVNMNKVPLSKERDEFPADVF